MTKPCVAICMPIKDTVRAQTMFCLMNLSVPRPYHFIDVHEVPVDEARNEIAAEVMKDPSITHLLWIDDDMTFERDAAMRLLAHDLPIVGGLCHTRKAPYMPTLIYNAPSGSKAGIMYRYDYPREVIEVDATGTAFLLVKREVMEAIAPTLKEGEQFFTNTGGGEDVSFCRRAKAAGYKIHVDCDLGIGHISEVIVTDAFARRNRTMLVNPWSPNANVTKCGLRIIGDEANDEGERHRARYRWAADRLRAIWGITGPSAGIVSESRRVLDYGCGTGYGVDMMRVAGFDAHGIDVDGDAIRFGRERWMLGDLIEETCIPTRADAIVSFEVLEHLDATPVGTLAALLDLAPIVIGSVPYREPAGANPHHRSSMLEPGDLAGSWRIEFFVQGWDATIEPLPSGVEADRAKTPIMLFVARRA